MDGQSCSLQTETEEDAPGCSPYLSLETLAWESGQHSGLCDVLMAFKDTSVRSPQQRQLVSPAKQNGGRLSRLEKLSKLPSRSPSPQDVEFRICGNSYRTSVHSPALSLAPHSSNMYVVHTPPQWKTLLCLFIHILCRS